MQSLTNEQYAEVGRRFLEIINIIQGNVAVRTPKDLRLACRDARGKALYPTPAALGNAAGIDCATMRGYERRGCKDLRMSSALNFEKIARVLGIGQAEYIESVRAQGAAKSKKN